MEQPQILFPDTVIPFQPRRERRPAGEGRKSRLEGEGLADRLRHDVQRQIAHRRRMLAHLSASAPYSRETAK
ncbi:MAG: hypothetical protein M3R55_15700 [Acidobacteriota bacterium]|nr:hypothetical protein [Acidobacteriota bacterium]